MSIAIQLSNSSGVYFPGQVITGVVILELEKESKCRALTIEAKGKARCRWSESESYRVRDHDGNTRYRSRSIPYYAKLIYFDLETTLWRPQHDGEKIPAGRHQYAFQFLIPPHCAPSFEGEYGSIRYKLKVTMDKKWAFDKTNRTFFTVAPTFDLNTIPQALRTQSDIGTKKTGAFFNRHGKISYETRLLKSGFVPGEPLYVEIEVQNDSSRPVISAEMKLKQIAYFTAFRNGWCGQYVPGMMATCGGHEKQDKNVIAEKEYEINVPANSHGTVELELTVPATVASFNTCPVIKVEYYVNIEFSSKGSVNNTMKSSFDVMIGTIPIFQGAPPPNQQPPPGNFYPNLPVMTPSAPAIDEKPPSYGFNGEAAPYPNASAPYPPTSGMPPYPAGQGDAQYPVAATSYPGQMPYPSAPMAQCPYPPGTGMPGYPDQGVSYPANPGSTVVPSAPPPSYEDSIYGLAGTRGLKKDERYVPKYPVYHGLTRDVLSQPLAPPLEPKPSIPE